MRKFVGACTEGRKTSSTEQLSPQTKNVRHRAPEYVGPQLDQRDVHLHRDYLVDLQTLKQALQRFLRLRK
jgi:hypothetical protein